MKKLILFAVLVVAILSGQATNPTTPVFAPPQILQGPPIPTATSQCITPVAHQASSCPVENSSGKIGWYDWDGSVWQPRSGGGVKTVNGKAPDANGNVQIFATTTVNAPSATTALQ